jgi:integrase/recombinase XerD
VSANYVRLAGRFVAFLAERGVVPALPPAPDANVHPQILDYQRWLSVHRGLSDRSVSRQGRMVTRLPPALRKDSGVYSAATIRAVVRAEAQRCSPSHVSTMTSAPRLLALPRRVRFLPAGFGSGRADGLAMAAFNSAALPAD